MTSAFSSNDAEVLQRDSDLNVDDLTTTPHNQLHDVYEIDQCVKFIQDNDCKRIALQFPDELLIDAANVAQLLQMQVSAKVFILADTTYGSYDVDEIASEHVQADLIIHYGKSALTSSSSIKTLFVFGHKQLNCDHVCKVFNATYTDNKSNILLMIQPQWSHQADFLETRLQLTFPNLVKAKIKLPNQPKDSTDSCPNSCPDCTCRVNNINQLNAMETDEVVDIKPCCRVGFYELNLPPEVTSLADYSIFFIGSESNETLRNTLLHHPDLNGFVYDPRTLTCSRISLPVSKILMKRFYVIEKMKDAKTVGILVGTLGMAGYKEIISHLKKILSACGKKTYTFVVGKLNPNKLANFPEIDVFVLVACPEESIVDSKEYFKPICTPYEVELACNANREWGNIYPLDFRQLLPGGDFYVEFVPRSDDGDMSLITGNTRHHAVIGNNDVTTEVDVRNMESTLSVFHPHAAAHHFSQRSWQGLEQKLGETPVEKAKEGRSGLPISYSYGS